MCVCVFFSAFTCDWRDSGVTYSLKNTVHKIILKMSYFLHLCTNNAHTDTHAHAISRQLPCPAIIHRKTPPWWASTRRQLAGDVPLQHRLIGKEQQDPGARRSPSNCTLHQIAGSWCQKTKRFPGDRFLTDCWVFKRVMISLQVTKDIYTIYSTCSNSCSS